MMKLGAIGDLVKFGNGKVPYKIVAVIATGRVTTYDLVGKRRRYIAVPASKLNRF